MNPAELYQRAIRPNEDPEPTNEDETLRASLKRIWVNDAMTQEFLRGLASLEEKHLDLCRSKLVNNDVDEAKVNAIKSQTIREVINYARSTAV